MHFPTIFSIGSCKFVEVSANQLRTNKIYFSSVVQEKEMKSKDLREVVIRMVDDGMTSIEIAEQLRNVVSQRTVRRWSNIYKETGTIHLKTSIGRPRTVRTKGLIRKVKERLAYRGRRSARHLAKVFGISDTTMHRIIKGYFHGKSTIKTQMSQKIFWHSLSCRDFNVDHFGKKKFFISSINDGTTVKILKNVKQL